MTDIPFSIDELREVLPRLLWTGNIGIEDQRSAAFRLRDRFVCAGNPTHLNVNPTHLNANPTHLNANPTHLNDEIFNPCEDLNLLDIAAKVRNTGKADKQLIKETILELCRDRFLTPQQLGKLLNRSYMSLRERYIKQMVEEMLLERRFPNQPSHVNQAYRTREPSP